MTKFDDAGWVEKARKRKAYRDHERTKFFRSVGLKKGSHVNEITGAPMQKAAHVKDMLNLTARSSIVDADQIAALAQMGSLLSSVGLGLSGEKSGLQSLEADVSKMDMTALKEDWFTAPAFFD